MTTELIANSPVPGLEVEIATVATAINASSTTLLSSNPPLTVLQGSGQFRIIVDNEIMIVTAGNSGTTWTVTRGAEGSTAAPHAAATKIWHTLTAGALLNLLAHINTIDGVTVSGTPTDGEVITATSTTTATWQAGGGGGGSLTVTDGTNTEDDVTTLTFDGATVSSTGAGEATATITGGGGGLTVEDTVPTVVTGVTTLQFATGDTATTAYVTDDGDGEATVTISGNSPWQAGVGTDSAQLIGTGAQATGNRSVAEGHETMASGNSSHAEGAATQATDTAAHAEGNSTVASGINSHTEGVGTTASNSQDHAEGENTTASGGNSHAQGNGSQALGTGSHAQGGDTIATGSYSSAEGSSSNAIQTASHAHAAGYRSTVGDSQHVHLPLSPHLAGTETIDLPQSRTISMSGQVVARAVTGELDSAVWTIAEIMTTDGSGPPPAVTDLISPIVTQIVATSGATSNDWSVALSEGVLTFSKGSDSRTVSFLPVVEWVEVG